ncbi:MAG: M48 family metalloprotease [Gemmatimonadales bacterium]
MVRTRLLAAAFAATAVAGCARNPATGERELMLVSTAQEIEMGREYDKQVVATIGLYPDPGLQRYVQELGGRLAATSERQELPWTFRVVDDPTVNAFALPGGFIYVTRGIMGHLNSEAQLAGVLGHEIGHVTARHSASQISRQQLAGLGLAIGSIASSTIERYAGIASQALGVLFLKFSRDDENQADRLGLRYVQRTHYDPRQMPEVFRLLDRLSALQAGGGRLPEWLSTHPSPANRLERINQQIAALEQDFSGMTVNREGYERRLDGMVFGMNPREGFFRGTEFLHPELRFRVSLPPGWSTFNSKQAVAAISPERDAIVELTLAEGTSADQAARAFLSQEGLQAGTVSRGDVDGLPASGAPFAAATEQGVVRGTALFIEYGGAIYRLIAYSPEARWPAYQAVAERALRSFAPLSDPAVLAVQPQHLDVFTLDRRTTIAELARQRPSPVPAATLALLNQVDVQTPLEPGRPIKWVVGLPLP